VILLRKVNLEKSSYAYPTFLATFPVYYCVFALYASDYGALTDELTVGLGFLALAYVAYKLSSIVGLLLLATGYIAHAIYDVVHNSIFYNAGTPLWWPEFCGAVDAFIGLYLIYLALTIKQKKIA